MNRLTAQVAEEWLDAYQALVDAGIPDPEAMQMAMAEAEKRIAAARATARIERMSA